MVEHIPDRVAVIMAGGSGERFWPLSRYLKPKQFLHLASKTETLLEQTIANITPLIPGERIFLATGKHLVDSIEKYITGIPPENILAEPIRIFPTPTPKLITIQVAESGEFSIEILSLNGQIILSRDFTGKIYQVDLSSFEKGLYFITVRSKDYVRTEKIIKQ